MTTLAFYRELTPVNDHVIIVKRIDTNKLYIKKQLSIYDEKLYFMLQKMAVPGIPAIHHILRDEEKLIVIEDYLNLPTLADILSEHSRFPLDQALDIALQLCRIMQVLHSASPAIIHRDLKPSNVLLAPDGQVFLIDFNAAKTYDSGKSRDTILMGTADYAAPEQFGFSQSDARTDIYGLGVLLNVMLTGSLPKDKLHDGIFTKVIAKCTAMDPSDRFSSMAQLYSVLEGLQRRIGKPEYGMPRKPARQPQPRGLKSWLPPGFRTFKPWKMLLASIGYATILWLGLLQSVDVETTIHIIFNKLCATISLLLPIFFLGNYRGLSDKFPISNSYIPAIRILGGLIWSAIFAFALILLCVLLDML